MITRKEFLLGLEHVLDNYPRAEVVEYITDYLDEIAFDILDAKQLLGDLQYRISMDQVDESHAKMEEIYSCLVDDGQ